MHYRFGNLGFYGTGWHGWFVSRKGFLDEGHYAAFKDVWDTLLHVIAGWGYSGLVLVSIYIFSLGICSICLGRPAPKVGRWAIRIGKAFLVRCLLFMVYLHRLLKVSAFLNVVLVILVRIKISLGDG